jgi:predicted kinase
MNLILIRGLPSAGKSSLASLLNLPVFEADQFFINDDGDYIFDPKKLKDAHQACLDNTRNSLENGQSCIVANTFTQRWEMENYIQLANELDVRLIVTDLFDGGCSNETLCNRNTHGVPIEAYENMRARYEHDWKNGDPRPPWSR